MSLTDKRSVHKATKLDSARIEALLAQVRELPPGTTPPFLRAHVARFEARLASVQGEHDRAGPSFEAAAASFREIEARFWLGATLLEHAEWASAVDSSSGVGDLVEEAIEIFAAAGARPWLERAERLRASVAPAPEPAVRTPTA